MFPETIGIESTFVTDYWAELNGVNLSSFECLFVNTTKCIMLLRIN